MTDEKKVCCVPCGVKYLTEKQKQQSGVATSNIGICCLCGNKTNVISISYYNYLNVPGETKKPTLEKIG